MSLSSFSVHKACAIRSPQTGMYTTTTSNSQRTRSQAYSSSTFSFDQDRGLVMLRQLFQRITQLYFKETNNEYHTELHWNAQSHTIDAEIIPLQPAPQSIRLMQSFSWSLCETARKGDMPPPHRQRALASWTHCFRGFQCFPLPRRLWPQRESNQA